MNLDEIKPGDRIVGLSGFVAVVEAVLEWGVVVTFENGLRGGLHVDYASKLKPGVVPHKEGASIAIH